MLAIWNGMKIVCNSTKMKHFMRTGSNSINIHQPIYNTSIQSWKRYEKQLQPLIEVLKT